MRLTSPFSRQAVRRLSTSRLSRVAILIGLKSEQLKKEGLEENQGAAAPWH
jgi:hypothetical protein